MLSQFGMHRDKERAQTFYKHFFMEILVHVLTVVTDSNQIKILGENILKFHLVSVFILIFRYFSYARLLLTVLKHFILDAETQIYAILYHSLLFFFVALRRNK